MSDYKSTLAEVEVGDIIIIDSRNGFKPAVVTKATKTQLSVGDTRFMRDGGRIFDANKGDTTRAHAPLEVYSKVSGPGTFFDKMTEYRQAAAIARSSMIDEITQKLRSLPNSHLEYITDFIRRSGK